MDDSNLNNLRVAEVMAQFGQKGTFYLNDPHNWWQDSIDTGVIVPRERFLEIPRRLLNGGNSVGGHTLNHEMLPAMSKNVAFHEIMGVRVALEVAAASPVSSFVYPFVFYQSELRQGDDRADLEDMLRRSGFYQLAEHRYNKDWDSGLQDGLFIILDGSTSNGKYSESVLTQPRCDDDRPLFLVTMHAWVKQWGGPEFPKLADIYRKWSGRKDWWYCNQNEYAAYRYQALHSRLHITVEDNLLQAVLTRPNPLDLNDWTPLTLRVEGVDKDDVVSVESPGAVVERVDLGASPVFDIFHGQEHGAVEVYAETVNAGNADQLDEVTSRTEGLRALLYRKGHVLTLALRNDGTQALQDIRVTFRLPLRWTEGVVRKQVGTLAAGASAKLAVTLTERTDPEHYSDGVEYDVAQVDFCGARRARLFATCETPNCKSGPSFARNGFWNLGPLPGDLAGFDPQIFAKAFLEGGSPQKEYAVPWGENITWKTLEPTKAAVLDPDIIPTSGKSNVLRSYKWDSTLYFPHEKVLYVFYGQIVSPKDQTVRAVFSRKCVKHLTLNGQKVEGEELALNKGQNDVRILYAPAPGLGSSFEESNYGCYFRLTDAEGRRVENVRFQRPRAP
ncbi:MAG: NEW3 domain-containing protein [Gemmataceae bacterium]|nr:NEW3 domain-containing protein [Gemmataceae bacterium]